jgi:eukaryotic-like serine/threonine-protein kinase
VAGPLDSETDTLGGQGTQPGTLGGGSATLASNHPENEGEWGVSRVEPGQEIGPFVVQRVLGHGAMGLVVLAHDRELDRPVAIKLLLNAGSEAASARLLREAQATARLTHPNVVAVHRVGTFEGQIYLVMEYVEGGTLRHHATKPGQTWQQIVESYVQAGRGLAAAHAAGFVHRDFKPDNVLVGHDGRVRVTDFGLVTPVAAVAGPTQTAGRGVWDEAAQLDPNARLTQSGAVLGTPAYMAPEQFGLGDADPRADQFSYCVSLFEALFGVRPFAGATAANVYVAIQAGRIAQVSRHRVPAPLYAAIVRGLQFDPSKRWPSMDPLLQALDIRATKTGTSPVVVSLAVTGAVVVLAGGPATYWLTRSSMERLCSDPGAEVAELWNDDVRSKLQVALQRSERPDLDVLTPLVTARIDEFVETWTGMHEAACEATIVRKEHSEHVLSLRHACLARSAVELEAVIEILGESKETRMLAAAPGVLDVLTPLLRCGDINALEREGIEHEPSDDERAVLRELVRTEAMMTAGFREASQSMLADVIESAQVLDDRRAAARAHLLRAQLRHVMDDPSGAVVAAREAIGFATQARAHDLEAAARVIVLYSALPDDTFAHRAHSLIAEATDAAGRAKDDLTMARLRAATALAYFQLDDQPTAETNMAQALGFYEDLEDRFWAERCAARILRASMLTGQRRWDEAVGEAERARTIAVTGLGPEHPYVALALGVRGRAEGLAGELERAMATLLEAREQWTRAYGPEHHGLVVIEGRIGALAHQLGHIDAALEHVTRSLALLERVESVPGLQRAQLLDRLADLLVRVGRPAEAAAALKEAVAIYTRTHGKDHAEVVMATQRLDEILSGLDRPEH